jgi:hypothetical protein
MIKSNFRYWKYTLSGEGGEGVRREIKSLLHLRDGGNIIFKRRQKMLILGIHPSRDFYERFAKLLLYLF